MKVKFRFIALLLVLVMLFPFIVACDEVTVENKPAPEKKVDSEQLVEKPETTEKTDVKTLLLEALRKKNINVSMASVEAKFKGDLNVSFLSPKLSYSTTDIPEAENGYVDIPASYLLYMLGNSAAGSFEGALYQILFDTMLDGGYESLEEIFEGLKENITADKLFADYGSADGYLTAASVGGLFYVLALQNETAYHADDEDGIPDLCMSNIEAMSTDIMRRVNEINTSDDPDENFESILSCICENNLLNLLLNGCSSEEIDDLETTYDSVAWILNSVYEYILYNSYNYEDGDRTLYYDAFKPYVEQLLAISTATLFVRGDVDGGIFSVAAEALDEYLASDDGPIMSGEYGKIAYAFAAAAVVESNIQDIFENYGMSELDYAYFDLKTEKWYDVNGNVIKDEFIIVTESPLGYVANIGDEPTSFEQLGTLGKVYSVYQITGDDIYVNLNTYKTAFDKLFELYIDVIDKDDMSDDDELIFNSAILTYFLSYPQQNYGYGKVIDPEFAQKYILAAIGKIDSEKAEKNVGEIAELFFTDDEGKTKLHDYLLATRIFGDVEIDGLNDEMLMRLINVFISLDGTERFGYDDFFYEIAIHLYVKYFVNEENNEYDGIPLYVACGMLYAYAKEELGFGKDDCNSVYSEVIEYYAQYYKGMKDNSTYPEKPLVYYEDFAAMLLMLSVNEGVEELKYYDYPFDFAKQFGASVTVYYVLMNRAQNDESEEIFDTELAAVSELLQSLCSDKEGTTDRFVLASEVIATAFNAYRNNTALVDALVAYSEYLADTYSGIDYNGDEYDMSDIFGMYIEQLFTEIDGKTNLRLLIENALGTENEEYNNALEASLTAAINGVDAETTAIGTFLENIDVVLKNNGIYVVSLGDIAEALKTAELEEGDDMLEAVLDIVFSELFKERAETTGCDYTVLTDIILAYIAGDDEALAAAFTTAINEFSPDYINDKTGDCVILAYLRALSGDDIKEKDIVIANMFTVLYMSENPLYVIPALYLDETEFISVCGELVELRRWAGKYLPAITNGDDVKSIEVAVEYLLATGYFEDFEELPEKTDEKYYEKLATLYASNEYFDDTETAEAVVAYIFGGDIAKYADKYLEIANEFAENEDISEYMSPEQIELVKFALYSVSTKAYLAIDDASTVDWAKTLAWIPEMYAELTGAELNIANYRAFSEVLRPTFAEEVSSSITATVVPYETANEIVLVFTVKGDIDHSAFDCDFELVIEMNVTKEEYAMLIA